MAEKLTPFEGRCLAWILQKVVQKRELATLFRELRSTMELHYYEDNQATREAYLLEELHSPQGTPSNFRQLASGCLVNHDNYVGKCPACHMKLPTIAERKRP